VTNPAATARLDEGLARGMTSPVAERVDQLLRDGAGLLVPMILADLAAGAERLREARCNVVVLGAFKRGKSSLINALLERDLLPTGVVPLTSVPTIVRDGQPERLRVGFLDGRDEEHPLGALADLATEPGNPGNRRGVAGVEIHLRHALLASGLQLVDTPGIGSVHLRNTRSAHDALGSIDAALCIVSADQPLAAEEVELYRAAAAGAGETLFALTKSDRLTDAELGQALEFVERALRGAGLEADVLAVSGVDRRGLPALRERLAALADRTGVVARALERKAGAAAVQLAERCDLELRALTLPLDELERRQALHEDRLAELEAAHRDAADTMQRRTARLLAERVDEPLHGYAREHALDLRHGLDAEAERLADASPRPLAAALEAWIDTTVRRTFSELAGELHAQVASGLVDVAASHRRRIEGLLDDVRRAAEEALGARGLRAMPAVALSDPSGFTFKLHDPRQGLHIVVGTLGRSLPGAVGRRLVLAEARDRLHAMTDRHAGRLRSELAARAQDAIAQYGRELDAAMGQACATVRDAVDGARAERARGERDTRARQRDLVARRDRVLAAVPAVAGAYPAATVAQGAEGSDHLDHMDRRSERSIGPVGM
jgi:GTP-binding protein EngB required for normal cell division